MFIFCPLSVTLHLTVPLNTSGPEKPTDLFITDHQWSTVKNLLWAFLSPKTTSYTNLVNVSMAAGSISTLRHWASYYSHSVLIVSTIWLHECKKGLMRVWTRIHSHSISLYLTGLSASSSAPWNCLSCTDCDTRLPTCTSMSLTNNRQKKETITLQHNPAKSPSLFFFYSPSFLFHPLLCL